MSHELPGEIELQSVNFLDKILQDSLSGVIISKDNFYKRLSIYNKENNSRIDPSQILFWAIIYSGYTVATQIYPFIIEDLKVNREKETIRSVKKVLSSEIEILEKLYEVMEGELAPPTDKLLPNKQVPYNRFQLIQKQSETKPEPN